MNFYDLAERALELERDGTRLIRLNVGDTNLPTPRWAVDAAVRSLAGGRSGYGSAAGMRELRDRIARREECDVSQIVVGPGSKQLIYGLLSVLAKGPVVVPAPYWPAYELACKQLGLEMRVVRPSADDRWQLSALPLTGASALIICNPLNPTSTIYEDSLIRRALDEARQERVAVILDEAYKGLAFREIPRYDAIRVRSFSKEFNMEGWRLGYAVAPEEIARQLTSFLQITTTCVPPFVQEAGMACLDHEEEILGDNRGVWRDRATVAEAALAESGFGFVRPEAGIYLFASHPAISDAGAYAMELLNDGVVVAPGGAFGGYDRHLRLCLNQSEDLLREAIGRMSALATRPRQAPR